MGGQCLIIVDTEGLPQQNVYLGNALLTAHHLELSQEWSGCVLSPDLVSRLTAEVAELKKRGLVVDFDVPFKGRSVPISKPHSVVNWFYYKSGDDRRREKLQRLRDAAKGRARRKLENTLDFLAQVENRRLASVDNIKFRGFESKSHDRTYRPAKLAHASTKSRTP